MIHPVGACATAAVSVEEGVDKIRLGKAELVVAGGFDDLTLEAIIGFGDMAATADTEMMRGQGHQRRAVLPRQRPAPARASSKPRAAAPSCWPAATWRSRWACRCWRWSPTRSPSATACTPRSRLPGWARWVPAAAARTRVLARVAGQAGCGRRRHRGDLQARHLDAGQRSQRDRAARAARGLDGPFRGRAAVHRQPEEPDRARQGRRGGLPDDGPVPDPARRRHPAEPQPGLRRRRAGRPRRTSCGCARRCGWARSSRSRPVW